MKKYIRENLKTYDISASGYMEKGAEREEQYNEMVAFFLRYLNKEQDVLEIGPGNGIFAKKLSEYVNKISGIEFSSEMAYVAKTNFPQMDIIVDEFTSHEFEGKYNLLIGIQFIHLFKRPERKLIFKKFKKLLKDDGYVFLTSTIHKKHSEFSQKKHDFGGKPKRYRVHFSPSSVINMVKDNGFKVIEYSEIHTSVATRHLDAYGYFRLVISPN